MLTRSVEPGNAVAALLQAVTLFTLAEDLALLRLQVYVDEADVGSVTMGQNADFTVSAYPGRKYPARVTRVAYGSTITDNVLTYLTHLDVDNRDLSLRPSMTATATITATQRHDVLLVPNSALRAVTKVYGRGQTELLALKGIDLEIDAGEFVAIMGPSGSGKSTAMNILGCLDTPSAGQYLFQGAHVETLSRDQRARLRRRYLGFVFQGFNLLARTSAQENVELPLLYRGESAPLRHAAAARALQAVGLGGLGTAHAGRTLRRATATRRHRPGDRQPAGGTARRRTNWQPRYPAQSGNHGAPDASPATARSPRCWYRCGRVATARA